MSDEHEQVESNPFQLVTGTERRPKILVWGDSGAGKSRLARSCPSPVVIDREGGADFYGDESEFGIFSFAAAGEPAFKVERTAKEG